VTSVVERNPGRLDATNDMRPSASSAPSMDHDNADFLGTWGDRTKEGRFDYMEHSLWRPIEWLKSSMSIMTSGYNGHLCRQDINNLCWHKAITSVRTLF
jgi:hypothetical protein